jgi:hypothetical protein
MFLSSVSVFTHSLQEVHKVNTFTCLFVLNLFHPPNYLTDVDLNELWKADTKCYLANSIWVLVVLT